MNLKRQNARQINKQIQAKNEERNTECLGIDSLIRE